MAQQASDRSGPWTARTWAAFVVLGVLMVGALPWLVNPWHPAMPGARDAAMYLACAKSLVAGEGYSYLGEPFVIRPPGMSVLLAPLVATRGFDFAAVNVLVSLFGVAAALALFAWSVPRVGEWVAAALALTVWWNGLFQEFCNRAMADVPGLAALLGCLLVARWAAREPSWRRELVLGLAIGASASLRTAALLLVPALVLERAVERLRARSASASCEHGAVATGCEYGAVAPGRERAALANDSQCTALATDGQRTALATDSERIAPANDSKGLALETDSERTALANDGERAALEMDSKGIALETDGERTAITNVGPARFASAATDGARCVAAGYREPWLAFARRRLAWLVLVPLLVIAPWSVRDARVAPSEQVEQTRIASYSVGMWREDPSDPGSPRVSASEVLARVPERSRQILSLVGTALASDDAPTGSRAFGALLLALAAVAWWRRWRAAELYLFGYTATIAIYFGFHERLALPIWVLALVGAVDALSEFAARLPEFARSLALAAGLATLAASGPQPRDRWPQFEAQDGRYRRLCAALAERIPVDARVGAPFGWHLSLYLDRPVWSLRPAWSRTRDAAKLVELVAKHRLDYIVLAPFDGVSQELYPQLVARFGDPERVESGLLFRTAR
ncbi:MAG: hypothetical protein HZA52_16515 [Planctomycetes bacterium]|nr:hypothetical protein [Planctomycetota bacterium]